ncbi:FAD-dependent monooxygenase [Mesorhizobium sp. LHD-90]|uniref:FAD-dependent monooxygenase n=1 Tax=Mesorhizobium sp. LHD-90 TaxID=3071414 RepID=UPI0027DFBEAE|nr:FAD-dependent monooxygenase [Mesorhizobium sp. LHD-90]MDQ6435930.1 FAD-dependent monooxygenase [Mesorhizobium sp. LHD-90]
MSTDISQKNAVLVVGAGPVGLTMVAELARHGVRCRLIDRAPGPLPYCRAIGVTPRTLEVWEDMGVARTMIGRGLWISGLRSVIADQPAQDAMAPPLGLPFAQLGLPQYETERVLTEHLRTFGVEIERGADLAGLEQDDQGVAVTIRRGDGSTERARFSYAVGCDGAHSTVRKALEIAFDGEAYPWPFMLGDVHIGWDLPYGMAFRAVRPVEGRPPDMFIAIPLPEPGRYRVSMLAPPSLVPSGGTEHGIQAEMKGPSLADLQAIADDLLPGKPRLTDLRWSSIFRISMRLASQYRSGRVFIAGDAAHIHPPTGGQGMNTGIQDAYNLAWKLALVVRGVAGPDLLDSYGAERRPVGADVVKRTQAASENYGRERGKAPDRLADTQILVSYRGTPFIADEDSEMAGPVAGDRAPDVQGLSQSGLGFPLRLFDVLRGTEHVLLIQLADPVAAEDIDDAVSFAREFHREWSPVVRIATITRTPQADTPFLTTLLDRQGGFAEAFGSEARAILVRPDGYIGWRGPSWRSPGLAGYLERVFSRPGLAASDRD